MKFIIFFIYPSLFYSERHTCTITYTEINGQTIAGFPEVSSVTTLDGQQIDCYDGGIQKLIPKQDWMKFASGDRWKEYTKIRERVQQTNKINIRFIMEQFSQTSGVHTYQRMYGCDWDDETGKSHGFDEHGYDGEDFIFLDIEELRFITVVPQGIITMMKWNNDRERLELLKQYYEQDCVYWIQYFLTETAFAPGLAAERKARPQSGIYVGPLCEKNTTRQTGSTSRLFSSLFFPQSFVAPEVSLLQKNSSSPVVCHASGFYPSAVNITWLRNREDHYEDVELGELLPNEDGTFQKTSILNVHPEEWKKHQYVCVVEHEGMTIQKNLTEDEIKSNKIFPDNWKMNQYFCVEEHNVKEHSENP
ncbi:major histocompatibility complex class I-related gene protein [Carassius gibelio]|uniref:major histocompatibility complex class I-related gene protein n=1 Tax=Carassius gibelio TaxID=101364 RepID=UPI00227745E7|nr:major histocompatibility complex class I-related gene protein [Carassius gibelio]